MVNYKLRLGDYKLQISPIRPKAVKTNFVDKNGLLCKKIVTQDKIEKWINAEGKEVVAVFKANAENNKIIEPFEKTDDVAEKQLKYIPKVEVFNLGCSGLNYIVKPNKDHSYYKLKEKLIKEDKAVVFPYVASKGINQHIGVVYVLAERLIMSCVKFNWLKVLDSYPEESTAEILIEEQPTIEKEQLKSILTEVI